MSTGTERTQTHLLLHSILFRHKYSKSSCFSSELIKQVITWIFKSWSYLLHKTLTGLQSGSFTDQISCSIYCRQWFIWIPHWKKKFPFFSLHFRNTKTFLPKYREMNLRLSTKNIPIWLKSPFSSCHILTSHSTNKILCFSLCFQLQCLGLLKSATIQTLLQIKHKVLPFILTKYNPLLMKNSTV